MVTPPIDLCKPGGVPKVCTPLDECHIAGTCDPATGVCSDPVAPDGTACSDGDACTQGDSCQTGSCLAGTPLSCSDGNSCTTDECDPSTGMCSHLAVPDGTSCNDANACTQDDHCQAGSCQSDGSLSCDDGNLCTADSCHPWLGCLHIGPALCGDGLIELINSLTLCPSVNGIIKLADQLSASSPTCASGAFIGFCHVIKNKPCATANQKEAVVSYVENLCSMTCP